MDGYFDKYQDEAERNIRAAMAGEDLPSWASGFDIEFGPPLVDDEPTVQIRFHVPKDLQVDQGLVRQYSNLAVRLRHRLSLVVPGHLVLTDVTVGPSLSA